MPKMRVSRYDGQPLFDIASYARRCPASRDRLSAAEIAQISRTVNRAPEVMVKVLPMGSHDLKSISRHFGYSGRYGELDLETDDGQAVRGKDVGRHLLEDWDLDLDERRRGTALAAAGWRPPPKHVHKLMLSMPAGTPPAAFLAAARNFLREQFALQHRYAFVLHTDEPHPHVHAVVKAVSEQGKRLNITKSTLREWRSEFARHLREQGIEANATDRAVRGQSQGAKRDGIYRAHQRGESTYMRDRAIAIASERTEGRRVAEPGGARLARSRQAVVSGWSAASAILRKQGQRNLAAGVDALLRRMPMPQTDKEWMSARLLERLRAPQIDERSPSR